MKLFSKVKEAKTRLSGTWAIEKSAYADILKLYETFEKDPKKFILDVNEPQSFLSMDFGPTSENVLSFNEDMTEAFIAIKGPLVDSHDCSTMFFGCTSYDDIISAISDVDNMSSISKTTFLFDSPGGMVSGVDDVAIAINSMKSETEARTGKTVASAAYWLASQCDTIVATSATAQFGSIGVVIEYWDASRAYSEQGFDKVSITSTNAPEKRVDALTEEGERKIRASLDEIEEIFHRRVAEGRKTTVSLVKANFGRGGMLLAEKSLSAGMIDKTEFVLKNNINSKTIVKEQMESNMTLKEYLAKHPESQKEIDAMISTKIKAQDEKHTEKAEEDKKRITSAAKYLTSEYDDKIKILAIDVIKGEKSSESLEVVVALFDKNEESENSNSAQEETANIGETPVVQTDSVNTVDEAHEASVKRIKGLRN